MFDPSTVSTPLAGFVAGLVTSIHCVGMCGPLACAILPRNGSAPGAGGLSHHASIGLYHASRIGSYTAVGLLAGAMGAAVAGLFSLPFAKILPWGLVALFIVFLLGWEKQIPKIPYLSALFFRFRLRAGQMKRPVLALLLGGFTPFLPCAPLYLMFGVALLTGSAVAGGAMMAAFALGTIAPMWLMQSQFVRWQGRLSPRALSRIQKGLAIASILLISWRAFSLGDASPDTLAIPNCCPL